MVQIPCSSLDSHIAVCKLIRYTFSTQEPGIQPILILTPDSSVERLDSAPAVFQNGNADLARFKPRHCLFFWLLLY